MFASNIKSMVQAKITLFPENLIEQANWFKVLGHPARLQILQFLSQTKSCITGDISDELPLSRTTVNQHIKDLREMGLIQGQVEGASTKYCLNPSKVMELKNMLQKLMIELDTQNYTCK